MKKIITTAIIFLFMLTSSFSQTNNMKVIENQPAPDFTIADVYGQSISLSQFKGKKILLTFFRTAGCPVCNLRFHQLEQQWDSLKNSNLVFIAVYASEKENLLHYLRSNYGDSTKLYPIFIANTDRSLYKLYQTDRSTGKLIKSLLFHGGLSNVNKGKKLFKEKIKDDGPTNLINADFLIDENGKVVRSYYGKYSGDFIPVGDIKRFASGN